MPSRSVWTALAAAALAGGTAPLAAQAEAAGARRPTFARVESAAGEPVAGAVVVFAGCVPHLGPDVGPRDLVQVQADARGRAQAKLLPELCYVAWAVGPPDAAGACAESPVERWFGAGTLLTLRCGPAAPPRALRVVGGDAWRARGPLRFVAWTAVPGVDTELAPDAAGVLHLPPGPVQLVEVRTADGAPLLHVPAAARELVLPPPQPVRVRVRDEHGAPLAGADVRLRVGRVEPWRHDTFAAIGLERWRALGTTDADGLCTVEVPYGADPLRDQEHGDLLLFAGAAGRPAVVGGVLLGNLYVDDRKSAERALDELVFTCRRAAPLAGRLGPVPAGTTVHLAAVCKVFLERTSYRNDPRTFTAAVGADGAFAFDDVPAELHSCRLSLVPPPGRAPRWPIFAAASGRELPPEVLAESPAVLRGEQCNDLTVQVLEPDGGPSRGLVAYLAPARTRGVWVRESTVRFPLDATGTATLRLAPGPWVVLAWSDTGWAARLLELAPGATAETLPMQPMSRMLVELRDDADRPLSGALVTLRGTTTRGTEDPLLAILQNLRASWKDRWQSLRTDERGRVAIPFVPIDGVAQKLALVWPGGRTPDFELVASDDWRALRPLDK